MQSRKSGLQSLNTKTNLNLLIKNELLVCSLFISRYYPDIASHFMFDLIAITLQCNELLLKK